MEPSESHGRCGGRGESPERLRLSRLIAEALIEPVFQPIVDLQHGEVAGFETLTRPARASGFANPSELFDVAAGHGLLWPLEVVTRRAAFQAAASWPPGQLLFMNCSPQVFADPRFASEVRDVISKTDGLSPSRVVLEITERSEQEHVQGLSSQVEALKRHGFQIAIDDVGAGTSGLNRIMKLRPHWLKLDRDLIESIDRDRVKQNLIRFLVHFARVSGVKVIAEGIEREQELATLMDLGIVHAQGYYLGRPGPRDQSLDLALVNRLRDRWSAAQARRRSEPKGNRIERLARPALAMPGSTPAARAAAELASNPELAGICILDGTRYLGWCPRESLAFSAGTVGALAVPDTIFVSPDASIADALDLASSREERAVAAPLTVIERGRVLGVVTIRDLLAAAAELARNPLARTASVTGLPGRVPADEHLQCLFARARHGRVSADAAIVDIRHFADYNGAFGYELGDELLQTLRDLIATHILGGREEMFLAHLGDDRFLITAPPDVLHASIPELVRGFEQAVDHYCRLPLGQAGPATPATPAPTGSAVVLRIILLPDVLRRVQGPRELYRLATQLRQGSLADTSALVGSRCVLIRDEEPRMRLSA